MANTQNDAEHILKRIRDAGFTVEAGTEGYQVHMTATDADGQVHEVTRPNEYEAALELAKLTEVDAQR